ncbi:MAG: hypothetical protein HOK41_17400 [Nitrospina sp.]|jgi:hypothetical protein|nr:hypothetical protein [Nitrospina sp.]MBT6717853.1 hypothetical protein [Nitrospina sp.]
MESDDFFEKEYENLNDAILEAIVSSREIRKILETLKKQEQIDNKSVLNLFLSLDELYEMISEKKNSSMVYKLEPVESNTSAEKEETKKRVSTTGKNKDIIDGKSLSRNEALFENFYQGKFNEDTWMKKARIRLQ